MDNAARVIQHDLWPLNEIDPSTQKFPCCLVWTPLPVVSWLGPFVGHVAICREDGTIVDFSGDNMIHVGQLFYGAVARYYQVDRQQVCAHGCFYPFKNSTCPHKEKVARKVNGALAVASLQRLIKIYKQVLITLFINFVMLKQCCFARNFGGHTCHQGYQHAEFGTAISWDDSVQLSRRTFEHRNYNIFSCNGHSFAANCLNRLSYGGSLHWNMVNVGALIMFKGQWVNGWSILRSLLPFIGMLCFGYFMIGWAFPIGLFSFFLLIFGWYVLISYCCKIEDED